MFPPKPSPILVHPLPTFVGELVGPFPVASSGGIPEVCSTWNASRGASGNAYRRGPEWETAMDCKFWRLERATVQQRSATSCIFSRLLTYMALWTWPFCCWGNLRYIPLPLTKQSIRIVLPFCLVWVFWIVLHRLDFFCRVVICLPRPIPMSLWLLQFLHV